jgi:hypothetical protein
MATGLRWVIVLALAGAGVAAVRDTEPDEQLARVRLVVTSKAANVAITVGGATIASYISSMLSGAAAATPSRTGRTLQLSRNVPGQSAEARFDVVLADASPGSAIVWNLTSDANAETQIEVYAVTDQGLATLVDRFVSNGPGAQFTSSLDLLASPGRVRARRFHPRLVLAHYYPWYTVETWRDPQMADRPPRLYSTESQADVNNEVAQARSAGIDAFVVSWQGLEAQSGFNDRRMRVVLEAARNTTLRVCAYTETYVANPTNDQRKPPDPQTVFEWLVDLVDRYGSHPAYLRVGERPVIFVYLAPILSEGTWAAIMARLRAGGRNPLLIGDFARSTLLEPFDGEYQYTNVFSSESALLDLNRTESLRVRTYHLLRQGDRRRIWVASVTPGFDDSHLVDRVPPHVVDRSDGTVYDRQWRSAIETGADWVVVTSWNEWWENTHVEPSERYGTAYLDRTRVWANAFKAVPREVAPPRR